MLKKFTGVLLSAALIVSAVGALTALPTTAANGSFTPQHMKVNFSDYVLSSEPKASSVLSTGEVGMNAKRVSWYKENDDTNSWLKFTSATASGVTKSQDPNLYSLLVNPTGKAGRSNGTSPTILDSDPIYKIENGVRYRVSFKYKLDLANSPANNNLEVCVLLGAAATGTMGYKNPQESSAFDLDNNCFKFGKSNQYNMVSPVSGKYALTASKDVWKEVSVDFVAEQSNKDLWKGMVDSMILGFVPLKGSVVSTSALYDLYIDDIVVDRVASANIVKDGKTETVYGAPACDKEYRKGFGTCGADKIPTVSTNGNTVELTALYSDAELTTPATNAVFSVTSADTYYAKAIAPKKTEVYESTTADTGYAVGTNVFGTGFADIKANSAKISGASNFKEGFIIWTQELLGDKTLDISCVDDKDTSALKIETSVINSAGALNDTLYGVLKCRDVTDGKVSDRYAKKVYVARPFVSYELDGVTYYVYGNTETTSVEG